ncbi:hypothetical protein [Streptomyces sp. NPDC058411]|uniref:hypothetical protein n=1 Tax=Streptomyces sp. NPDC058411 TaxID=3346485 RepID=UPI00364BDD26
MNGPAGPSGRPAGRTVGEMAEAADMAVTPRAARTRSRRPRPLLVTAALLLSGGPAGLVVPDRAAAS